MELKQIVQMIKSVRIEEKLVFDDEVLIEQAVDIFISNSINDSKKSSQNEQKQEKNMPKEFNPMNSRRATKRQIWLLNKAKEKGYYTGSTDLSLDEASQVISALKEKYG